MASALRSRDSENSALKTQMEQLLQVLKERDSKPVDDTPSAKSSGLYQSQEQDEQRDQDIMSISARLEQELSSNKAVSLLDRLKDEISSLQQEYQRMRIDKHQLEIEHEA